MRRSLCCGLLAGALAALACGGRAAWRAPSDTGEGREPGAVPAFPEAEGFGARVTGGRGGRVLLVTTLAASGPGSLQAALRREGARIVVFRVSGVIEGDVEIPHGDVTIAGQTAPGAGITLRGRLTAAYEYGVDNIVIRHLRVRPVYDGSAGEQFDAIQLARSRGVMLDHVSASFGVDETIDLYESRDVTVQWSTITSSATEGHPEGEHNYGLINGPEGRRISVHHNLFAHHKNRAPAIANGPAEVINNVIYNVRHGFIHHNPASGPFNLVGNYFQRGADDELFPFYFDDENENGFRADDLRYHLRDNFIDDPDAACQGSVDDPWRECEKDLVADPSLRSEAPFDFSGAGSYYLPVTTHTSTRARNLVLARAGAYPRDSVARGAATDVRRRSGSWGARPPSDLLEGLSTAKPPPDGDGDGMADAWERERGLDPSDSSDHGKKMPSGYTAVEVYINELARQITP